MDFEEIMPRRALGAGHWDKKLMERLTQLSVADNYAEANREWIVTDNVWYIPFGDNAEDGLPEIHCEGDNTHPHECLCGHPIVWHFEVENTENGNLQIVGSEHIESYMVIRYFEKQGIDPATVTEEMIDSWITEKVKALKAEWWWNLHGDQFVEWFEAIRELDLRVNVRPKGQMWNSQTRRYEHQHVIRKRAEGKFGETGYRMASIVWRWNHPDNSRKQIDSRGYPNERLWNDLQIFAITAENYRAEEARKAEEVNQRLATLVEEDKVAEEEQKKRQIQYKKYAEERAQRAEKQNIHDAELAGITEEKRLSRAIAARMEAETNDAVFADMCEYYDIPIFNPNITESDWERRFLTDMVARLSTKKSLSERQLSTLRNIVVDEPLAATDKQKWYIKKLAGKDYKIPNDLDIKEASALINRLKGEEE